jgi:hypothetical protein
MNWMQNIDRPFSCPDQADPDTKIRISIPGELAMDLERIAQASGKSLEIIHFMLIRRLMEVHGNFFRNLSIRAHQMVPKPHNMDRANHCAPFSPIITCSTRQNER